MNIRALAVMGVLLPLHAWVAAAVDSTGSGYWTNGAVWGGTPPAMGQEVAILAGHSITADVSTAELHSLTVGGTLVFRGSNTVITSTTVTVTGTVTHLPQTATDTNGLGQWKPDHWVHFVCTNLTVAAGGRINVDGKGYAGSTSGRGNGPGASYPLSNVPGGAGYGGDGGAGTAGLTSGGPTYGSTNAPVDPGSGACYASAGGKGGDGGGLVRIEASGAVTVNGAISANGGTGGNAYGPGGSGGGIYIACRTVEGTQGVVSVNGGGTGNYGSSGGGGGRIAIIYNSAAESNVTPRPSIVLSASGAFGSYGSSPIGRPGTVYLTDSGFYPYPTLTNGALVVIPNTTNWAPAALTISNAWVKFVNGFQLAVTNDLTILGGLGRLDLPSPSMLSCGRDLIVSNGASLYLYSGATNGVDPDYGGIVNVGNSLVVASNCWVYSHSDTANGGSLLFQVGNLDILATNAGFNADARGFRGGRSGVNGGKGFGPGASIQGTYSGGAGYGGAGGMGNGSMPGGPTYGSSNAPVDPGSGAANDTGSGGGGGAGGGTVRIVASGRALVNGTITANGQNGVGAYAGGGSGGAIYIQCKNFTGTNGILSVQGGNWGVYHAGGGGGGGRIAVWRMIDRYQGPISSNTAGGTGMSNGMPGTVVLGWLALPGTAIVVR